jgi:predicted dehydrogenase
MEKPGSPNLSDFERLIATLKEKKLAFSTGYMYRFNPKIIEAIEKAKNGELGKIYSVEAHMSCKHAPVVREWLAAFPGGMMFFLGCHLVDLIYRIKGEPNEVIPLNSPTGIDGVCTDTYGMAVFKYDGGVSFAKTCADEFGGFLRRQLVISGEKGTIEIKPLEVFGESGQYTVSSENYSLEWVGEWSSSKSELYDRYEAMMCNFAEIINGKENPYTYDYELSLFKLIMKACGVN